MKFEQHGFKTGNIVLPGIEFPVYLPEDFYFRDDGVVDNIYQHNKKVRQELESDGFILSDDPPIGREDIPFGKTTFAHRRNGFFKRNIQVGALMFVKRQSPEQDRFCIGHESMHIVDWLIQCGFSLEKPFLEMMKGMGFSLNPFTRNYNEEESLAHVGGLISAYKAGQGDRWKNSEIYEDLMASRIQK